MNTQKGRKPFKPERHLLMAKNIITYSEAVSYVLDHCEVPTNIASRLTELRDSIGKRNATHGKAETIAARKEKVAAERAEARSKVIDTVGLIIRAALTTTPQTDKEIYDKCAANLPEDMTLPKVRYILSRGELGESVTKVDNGKNPNTYYIKEGA